MAKKSVVKARKLYWEGSDIDSDEKLALYELHGKKKIEVFQRDDGDDLAQFIRERKEDFVYITVHAPLDTNECFDLISLAAAGLRFGVCVYKRRSGVFELQLESIFHIVNGTVIQVYGSDDDEEDEDWEEGEEEA